MGALVANHYRQCNGINSGAQRDRPNAHNKTRVTTRMPEMPDSGQKAREEKREEREEREKKEREEKNI